MWVFLSSSLPPRNLKKKQGCSEVCSLMVWLQNRGDHNLAPKQDLVTWRPFLFFRFLELPVSDFNSSLVRNSHFRAKEYTKTCLWKHQRNLFTVWSIFQTVFWVNNECICLGLGCWGSSSISSDSECRFHFKLWTKRDKNLNCLWSTTMGKCKSLLLATVKWIEGDPRHLIHKEFCDCCIWMEQMWWGTCVQAPPGLTDYRDQVPLRLPPVGGWSLHKRKWK